MRITQEMLEKKVSYLNQITNNPEITWKKKDNKNEAQIGNYHLDYAYGGVELVQVITTGGGINDIFRCGHVPKRELYDRICAYIDGIEVNK